MTRLRLTAPGPTLVRAREKGFYPAQRRVPGDVFALREGDAPAAWMEPLAPKQAASEAVTGSVPRPLAERGSDPEAWPRTELAAFLKERGQTAHPRAKDTTLAKRVKAILAVERG